MVWKRKRKIDQFGDYDYMLEITPIFLVNVRKEQALVTGNVPTAMSGIVQYS